MTRLRTATIAVVSTVAFGSFAASSVTTAFADDTTDVSCATQQAQVDKATAKLADLAARFAARPTHKNLKAKKAQAQRVAHATARLSNCSAAQTS